MCETTLRTGQQRQGSGGPRGITGIGGKRHHMAVRAVSIGRDCVLERLYGEAVS